MTGTARREVVVSVSDDEWHVTSGHLSLEMLLCVEYSIFHLGTSSTRSSSADEIANVNFLYARGSGYVLERMFTKFIEMTQCNGHYAVQGHSRSPILEPVESSYDFLL